MNLLFSMTVFLSFEEYCVSEIMQAILKHKALHSHTYI